ncbi:unnamed protein product [Parnassius apollo]|uniref:(apollo) hypothetical protein n=1 Tax=Parnassius apollo TaxID=110799 RepID=A0A8S3XD93_PARAO|nr:unnamed protein product [Parnassius apollo]
MTDVSIFYEGRIRNSELPWRQQPRKNISIQKLISTDQLLELPREITTSPISAYLGKSLSIWLLAMDCI